MVEGALIVKTTDEAVPEDGTLPVPDQPVHTYWVPVGPAVGEVTDSFMLVPELNQPLAGEGESSGEDTVK
jgi:hypothetical protein